MVELRCNTCTYLSSGFCNKLKEVVPNGLAKLFYGGAVGIYAGTVTYPSKCGIEKELKHEAEVEVGVLVPENVSEELSATRTMPCNGSK
jgi:hypothetical protein